MPKTRKTHPPALKATVAVEAIQAHTGNGERQNREQRYVNVRSCPIEWSMRCICLIKLATGAFGAVS